MTQAVMCFPQSELPWSDSGESVWRFRFMVLFAVSSVLLLGTWLPLIPIETTPTPAKSVSSPPVVVKWLDMNLDPVIPEPPAPVPVPKIEQKEAEMAASKEVTQAMQAEAPKQPEQAAIRKAATPKLAPAAQRSKPPQAAALSKQRATERFDDIFGGGGTSYKRTPKSLASVRDNSMGEANESRKVEFDVSRVAKRAGVSDDRSRRSVALSSKPMAQAPLLTVPVNVAATRTVEKPKPVRAKKRSRSNIQKVFNRQKRSFDRLYARALRSNAGLQGRIVFQLTVAPSGAVSSVSVVSSELSDRALEKKLLIKVRQLNFGIKSVQSTTLTYPIQFYPA